MAARETRCLTNREDEQTVTGMARELKEIIGDLLVVTGAPNGWVHRGIDVRALCAETADQLARFDTTGKDGYVAKRYEQARRVVDDLRDVLDKYEAQLDRPATQVKLKRRNHDEHPLQPDDKSRRAFHPDSNYRGTLMAYLRKHCDMTDEQLAAYAETTVEDVRQAIDKATK